MTYDALNVNDWFIVGGHATMLVEKTLLTPFQKIYAGFDIYL